MISGHSVLGLVIGRGGSKGLPRKNVLLLCGKPMVAWTVAAACASRYIDRVIVSSDDSDVIAAAVAAGAEAPFVRPFELATDQVQQQDVMLHALKAVPGRWYYLVLLQASSPLRDAADIDVCIERIDATGAPTCLSISETMAPPYQTFLMNAGGVLKPVIDGDMIQRRRQDMPKTYQLNGAVCVVRTAWFRQHRAMYVAETVGAVIPFEHGIDIDDATDLALAEFFAVRAASPGG
jgi:CMP-N,N'-diacetyllegionaminic acid synthase